MQATGLEQSQTLVFHNPGASGRNRVPLVFGSSLSKGFCPRPVARYADVGMNSGRDPWKSEDCLIQAFFYGPKVWALCFLKGICSMGPCFVGRS